MVQETTVGQAFGEAYLESLPLHQRRLARQVYAPARRS